MLIDTSFSAKSLNIRHLIDSQGMSLIEWNAIEGFACSERFSSGGIFDECKSAVDQYLDLNAQNRF